MTITVRTFARLREILGPDRRMLEFADAPRIADVWSAIAAEYPAIVPLRTSTRFARNGVLAPEDTRLAAGDELALLPPVGGG